MSLRPGLWPEQVGDEVLILDAEHGVVHRLSEKTAEAALRIMKGATVVADAPGVNALREAGLLDESPVSDQVLSRRRALTLGTMVVGLGVVSVALPLAAAAASVPPAQQPTAAASPGDALVGVTASGG